MDYPATGSGVYDSIALTRVDANTFDAHAEARRQGRADGAQRGVGGWEGDDSDGQWRRRRNRPDIQDGHRPRSDVVSAFRRTQAHYVRRNDQRVAVRDDGDMRRAPTYRVPQ
jgi:hypothetical protein